MDLQADLPIVDPDQASDLHPLEFLQQLSSAVNPAGTVTPGAGVGTPVLPPAPVAAPSGESGWRSLIHLMAPVIGGLAMGNSAKQTGFLNGWTEGAKALQDEKDKKDADARRQAQLGSQYMVNIGEQAQNINDPVQFAQFVSLADTAGAKAGYTTPGQITNALSFPKSKLAAQQLNELNGLIDGAEKNGYSADDLASSGATFQLKDGTHVPVSVALDLTRRRPEDASGTPIQKPEKPDNSEMGQYMAAYAKQLGKKVADLTPAERDDAKTEYAGKKVPSTLDERAASLLDDIAKAKSTGDTATATTKQAQYDRIVQAKKDLNAAGRNPDMDSLNMSLKELQLENERRKAKENGGGYEVAPGSREERLATQLASGDLTFSDFNKLMGARNQTMIEKKQAIYDKAMEINPSFKPAAFEMGYKFASNPKTQNQIASINNVVAGVPDLLKFSDAAARSGVTELNKFVLPGGVAIGGRTYSDLKTARTAFADELSGALGFGGATDMAKKMGFDMTDTNLSPENFKSAIQNVVIPFVQRKKASMTGQMGPYGEMGGGPTPPPAAASAPAKGERRMINGKLGEWDGKGWKAVQ